MTEQRHPPSSFHLPPGYHGTTAGSRVLALGPLIVFESSAHEMNYGCCAPVFLSRNAIGILSKTNLCVCVKVYCAS